MNYSCAYFTHPEEPLEAAQLNKLRHVAAKLKLAPGMRVLDIGSGWGALAIYLAQICDVQVTGSMSRPSSLRPHASGRAPPASRTVSLRRAGLSRNLRPIRPDRLDRHDGACRRRLFRRLLPHHTPSAGARRLRLDPRHRPDVSAWFDARRSFANTFSPGPTRLRCPRSLPRPNVPACGLTIVRSGGCTTTGLCAIGGSALRPSGRPSSP